MQSHRFHSYMGYKIGLFLTLFAHVCKLRIPAFLDLSGNYSGCGGVSQPSASLMCWWEKKCAHFATFVTSTFDLSASDNALQITSNYMNVETNGKWQLHIRYKQCEQRVFQMNKNVQRNWTNRTEAVSCFGVIENNKNYSKCSQFHSIQKWERENRLLSVHCEFNLGQKVHVILSRW